MIKLFRGKFNNIILAIFLTSTFLIISYIFVDIYSFTKIDHSIKRKICYMEFNEKLKDVSYQTKKLTTDLLNSENRQSLHYDIEIEKNISEINYKLSELIDLNITRNEEYTSLIFDLQNSISSLTNVINNHKENQCSSEYSQIQKPDNKHGIRFLNNFTENIDTIIMKADSLIYHINNTESNEILKHHHLNRKIRYVLIFISLIFMFFFFIIKITFNKKLLYLQKVILNPDKFIDSQEKYFYNDEFTTTIDNFIQLHQKTAKYIKEIGNFKNYLNNIIDSMPSIVISLNNKLEITQWNKVAEKITGYEFLRVKDKNIVEVIPYFAEKSLDLYNVSKNNTIFHENQIHLFSEPERVCNITAFPLISDGNKGIVVRIDDISEIEKKEQLLRQAQKMESIGTLAGGLAHDFNNILGGIIATLSIMHFKLKQKTEFNKEFLLQQIDLLMELSEKASDLVRQLLTLSRKNEVSMTPLDLNSCLKRVVKISKNTFDKSIDLSVKYYPESCNIIGDLNQLDQVLLNIMINSMHSMTIMRPKDQKIGGKLHLSIDYFEADKAFCSIHPDAEEKTYWCISISDTGIGIEKNNLTKIFDPFFTTKKQGSGTGLGLSMVYSIVHQHNGFTTVYSEPNKGTTFNLYFPIYQNQVKASDIVKTENMITGKGNILIIDDDNILREIMSNILDECGYTVSSAHDGQEGIDILKNLSDNLIDLVIVDMIMPKTSGLEVVKFLKINYPNVKIILTSGFHQDERIEQAKCMEINHYLPKPFTMHKLSMIVHSTISSEKT